MSIIVPQGSSVIGIGIDLVEVDRIQSAHSRNGDIFLNRVYTQAEIDYCLNQVNPYPSLSARFAAKEAIAKAFGVGIGSELDWKSMSILKGEKGEPFVHLDEKGLLLLKEVQGKQVLISIAHTKTLAIAEALVVR